MICNYLRKFIHGLFRSSRLLLVVLVIFFSDPDIAHSQSLRVLNNTFEQGVDAYNDQNFASALQYFQELYSINGFNPLATASHLMLVKTYHHLDLDRQSITYGKEFLSTYRSSTYTDDIYFAMAQTFLGLREYINSANYFAYCITTSQERDLSRLALNYLLKTTDIFLDIQHVQALVDGAIGPAETNLFKLALLQKYVLTGEMSLASTTAQELERAGLSDIIKPSFFALQKAITPESKRQLAIAVLAPLSGPFSDIGNDILQGSRYALLQNTGLSNVSIIPVDNAGKALKTVRQMDRIASHQRVIAVIGPVWSENVIAGASLASIHQLPLVTPTATGNDLAGLNEYVFQLNPDFETRGRATAQYAVDSLGLCSFATVSPADPKGKALTDAFTAEIEERGGEIVAQHWYSGTPTDLTAQFRHLRKKGFELQARYAPPVDTSEIVSDSLRMSMPDSEFVALFQRKLEERAEKIDSSEIRLNSIDGMYFPVNKGDIDYLASSFAFHNFDTQPLGNVEWYDTDKLKQYATYIDSIIIVSDYFNPEDTFRYSRFVTDFRQKMGETPSTLHLYGYDTMALLLELIQHGHTTRAGIQNALRQMNRMDGKIRTYTLNGIRSRVNQTLQILQFTRRDGVKKLDGVTTGPRKVHPLETYFTQ